MRIFAQESASYIRVRRRNCQIVERATAAQLETSRHCEQSGLNSGDDRPIQLDVHSAAIKLVCPAVGRDHRGGEESACPLRPECNDLEKKMAAC